MCSLLGARCPQTMTSAPLQPQPLARCPQTMTSAPLQPQPLALPLTAMAYSPFNPHNDYEYVYPTVDVMDSSTLRRDSRDYEHPELEPYAPPPSVSPQGVNPISAFTEGLALDGDPIVLGWDDLNYFVTVGKGKKKKRRQILTNVTGMAPPGQMLAIMGPSGAGPLDPPCPSAAWCTPHGGAVQCTCLLMGWSPERGPGASFMDQIVFLLRTALRDTPRDHQPPTAKRHQLPTATNRQPPPIANRQLLPTVSVDQPPTANHCQPPSTTNHQPPNAANCHQPPPTANRPPPTHGVPVGFFGKTVYRNTFFFPVKDRPGEGVQ